MNHYNYKITNIKTNEYYIGVRSCKCPIEEDSYMGSSSIWNKLYVKEHREVLVKEILEIFPSRKEASIKEVIRLKECKNDPLCINKYFDFTPDLTGTKQTPEWIEKRKVFGEKNGMFGKHHTEETKLLLSIKNTGRKHTQEAKNKIGSVHKGKVYSTEVRAKISKSKSKIRVIKDIVTGEVFITSITEFCETRSELNPVSMRKSANKGWIYHKRYKISPFTEPNKLNI